MSSHDMSASTEQADGLQQVSGVLRQAYSYNIQTRISRAKNLTGTSTNEYVCTGTVQVSRGNPIYLILIVGLGL